jgi:hypothetical protein
MDQPVGDFYASPFPKYTVLATANSTTQQDYYMFVM